MAELKTCVSLQMLEKQYRKLIKLANRQSMKQPKRVTVSDILRNALEETYPDVMGMGKK